MMYSGETAPSGAEGALHMKLSGKRTGYGRNSGKPNGTEEAIPAKREESFRFKNGGALITGAPPFFFCFMFIFIFVFFFNDSTTTLF